MAELINKTDYKLPELDYDNVKTWFLSSFRIKSSTSNTSEAKLAEYIFNKIHVDKDMFKDCFDLIRRNYNETLTEESLVLESYSSQNLKESLAVIQNPFVDYEQIKYFYDSVVAKVDEDPPKNFRTCHGYVLYIKTNNNNEIILIKKTNPYITVSKNKILYSMYNSQIGNKLINYLQIQASCDAIILNGKCLLLTNLAEGIFAFERYYKNQCNECLHAISEQQVITGSFDFDEFASKGQTPRFFSTYDSEVINKLKNKDSDIIEILTNDLQLSMIDDRVSIENEDEARKFISLVCRRAHKELIDEAIVDVSYYTPL